MIWPFKKKPVAPLDPLEAFDRRLDALAHRATELRKSAATLLAVRAELARSLGQAMALEADARRRLERAGGDQAAVAVLETDVERARGRAADLDAERQRVEDDAATLADSVRKLEAEAESLRRERTSAAARLTASKAVSVVASRSEDRLDELLALDEARDEVERAHALAELLREDLKR